MLLMIDNYDSFTFNLVQYFGELGQKVKVLRNDEVNLDQIEDLNPEFIVISPGPCTPNEAGISIDTIDGSEIFKNIESPFQATRYHSLVIDPETLSKDFSVNAWTEDGTIMGIKHNSQEIYGLQFHPESLKTMDGMTMLNNFLKVND